MCGIAAHIDFKPEGSSSREKALDSMRKAVALMKRRGPDGDGVHSADNWTVGHARLAIMAPSSGAQPWLHAQSGCALVYNGEIFNYKAINAELEAKGRRVKTHCDTETVMESYLEWGESCVERFNGFFSFAIIDPAKGVLFAARDRLGVKPLHYIAGASSFSLASSVPAALACAGARMEPDYEAVSHYLTTGRVSFGERTLAKGVMALPPAHRMRVNLKTGGMSVSRYWSRPALSPEEKPPVSFEEAVERTASLLEDSVKMRLMSDVPLGAFLSGGLDSSIIALCAAKATDVSSLPLYCAGSDDERLNEYVYAELMASQLGCGLTKVRLNAGDFSHSWASLVREKGLPLSTSNEVSIYRLALELSKRCKVTLTGEGADEIFGGYMRAQFASYDLERSERGTPGDFEASPLGMSMTLAYGRCRFLNETDHFLSTACWIPYMDKAALFKPGAWDMIEQDSAVFSFYEEFFERYAKCSPFDRRMHLFAEFNLESLLHRIDNSTMAASVEARVPFTDYRLSELAFSLPDSYKMDWRDALSKSKGAELMAGEIDRLGLLETKRLPRSAFASSLPKEIVERRKMSFPVPIDSWLSGSMLEEVKSICLDSPIAKEAFERSELERHLARPGANLWVLANICNWSNLTWS